MIAVYTEFNTIQTRKCRNLQSICYNILDQITIIILLLWRVYSGNFFRSFSSVFGYAFLGQMLEQYVPGAENFFTAIGAAYLAVFGAVAEILGSF